MHYFKYEALKKQTEGDEVELDRNEASHLFKILRANPGESVGLLDGAGRSAEAEILPGKILKLKTIRDFEIPSRRIHLYLAPPRKQKMDLILKQAVELGVWRIVPMNCTRSVAEPDQKSILGRWNDLLFEGCKQSQNPFLPKLSPLMKFRDAVADAKNECPLQVYGSPRGTRTLQTADKVADIAYFVGPEGGFSPEEEQMMNEQHFELLRIGLWTLRVETAAVAGMAVLV